VSSIDYLRRSRTLVRRRDRALTDDAWIDRYLSIAPVGHLAICWEGEPLLHSNIFWFDGERIFWHTANVGRLRSMLDAGEPGACFTITEQGRILPAGTPLDFSTEYASVIIYGKVRLATDLAEKRYGLEGLMTKYAPRMTPGVDYVPMPDDDVRATSVYVLEIETKVGKHNVKPADYPGYPCPNPSFIDEVNSCIGIVIYPRQKLFGLQVIVRYSAVLTAVFFPPECSSFAI